MLQGKGTRAPQTEASRETRVLGAVAARPVVKRRGSIKGLSQSSFVSQCGGYAGALGIRSIWWFGAGERDGTDRRARLIQSNPQTPSATTAEGRKREPGEANRSQARLLWDE